MVVLAGYGVQLAKGLTPGASAVSAADFLGKLRLAYAAGWDDSADADGEAAPSAAAFDWARLGVAVGHHFRWAPSSGPHMCARGRAAPCCMRCPPPSLTRRRAAGWGRWTPR